MTHTSGSGAVVDPPVAAPNAPRPRLVKRLDDAVRAARLVIVDGEAGSGKSALISQWAEECSPQTSVCWLDLREARLLDEFTHAGGDGSPLLGCVNRLRAVTDHPRSPRGVHDHHVVVLENLPAESSATVNDVLDTLLRQTGSDVHIVGVCAGPLRLDLQRLGVGGQHRMIGGDQLSMTDVEIAAVLHCYAVSSAGDLIREIRQRTAGWAWGVGLAASLITEQAVPLALRETELTIADYLENSILSRLSDPALELITATSMLDDVSTESAAAIVGDDRRLSDNTVAGMRGFVRRSGDGSFRVHPLLRQHLLLRLRRTPAAVGTFGRRTAQHQADHGDVAGAIDTAVTVGDWSWAAAAVVESLRVTRLLAGVHDDLFDQPHIADGLGAADPVVMAAVALGRCWPETARRAIEKLDQAQDPDRPRTVASQLSEALVRMAHARWQADGVSGLAHVRRAVALMPQLSVAQRTAVPELGSMLQSHLGAFEQSTDARNGARAALERGASAFRPRPALEISGPVQLAAAACLGQLAWMEAVAGELRNALRHAGEILMARPADSNEIGVVYAQLATVWCQISRGELDQATQRLSGVTNRRSALEAGDMLPELVAATGVTAARLAAVAGQSRLAPEILTRGRHTTGAHLLVDRLRLILIEAELDMDNAETALRLLSESGLRTAEAQVLRARARIQLGDRMSVVECLRERPVAEVTLLTQVQLELIEGWLARSHGNPNHQRMAVDRALRIAGREQLRSAIAWAKPWLYDMITADASLVRRHGAFLASVRNVQLQPLDSRSVAAGAGAPVPALSDRELDILQRLGSLATNEEIAEDLFLSANTVKTHLKSLYRKLEVTRRSDAFRRGRALGLC